MSDNLRKNNEIFFVDKTDLAKQVDYNATANPLYIGYALPGSATSAAVWQICKLTHDASNNVTAIEWADGSNLYNQVWDDRAALTYS